MNRFIPAFLISTYSIFSYAEPMFALELNVYKLDNLEVYDTQSDFSSHLISYVVGAHRYSTLLEDGDFKPVDGYGTLRIESIKPAGNYQRAHISGLTDCTANPPAADDNYVSVMHIDLTFYDEHWNIECHNYGYIKEESNML